MTAPIVLCILDGWGEGKPHSGNAIFQANTPNYDALKRSNPMALLEASGTAVGLPAGQMGNSEVGHMTIGAGRVIPQDLMRIHTLLSQEAFRDLPQFQHFVQAMQSSKGACHIVGLISDGGVHAHRDHIVSLIQHLDSFGIPVKLHVLCDGRDTAPKDARKQLQTFLVDIANCNAEVVSVGGRYFGMDRDQRWDRIEEAMASMQGTSDVQFDDPLSYIQSCYDAGQTDEFIPPACRKGYEGPQHGDGLIAANFRADRMRQILEKLVDVREFEHRLGFSSYRSDLDQYYPVLFPKSPVQNTLGDIVANHEISQLRVAETEKYAHVTYFLNGGREDLLPGEHRKMIPSPKVATYDLQPEMAADEVTQTVVEAIKESHHGLIVVNFANPDMVGHTGDFQATVAAVETVDTCLGRVVDAVREVHGTLMVTADHGNADEMQDPSSKAPITSHSLNPVPFIMVGPPQVGMADQGELSDIAPTILELMKIEKPKEMTGNSLVKTQKSSRISISIDSF